MKKQTSDAAPRKRTKKMRWARKTLVIGPVQPVDGDSVACVKALIQELRAIGKDAYTLPTTSMYPQLDWILDREDVHPSVLPLVSENLTTTNLQLAYDTMCAQWLPDKIVVVDGQADRLGFDRGRVPIYTIDHHLDKGTFDDKHALVQQAPSAGCLLIQRFGIYQPILAVSILTDTFWLRQNMPAEAIDSLYMLRKRGGLTDELLMEYQKKLMVPKDPSVLTEIRDCELRIQGNAVLAILQDCRPDVHRGVIGDLMYYFPHIFAVRGDGYVSMRSNKPGADLRNITSKQGGGGHPSMAAVPLLVPIDRNLIETMWQEFCQEVGVIKKGEY